MSEKDRGKINLKENQKSLGFFLRKQVFLQKH